MEGLGNWKSSNKFLFSIPKNRTTHSNFPRHYSINQLSENCSNQKLKYASVESKVAIITGGAKVMGYEIADKLLHAKAKAVILADKNLEDMENITYKLNKKYGELKALFQPIDVMKKGDMMKLFKYTKESFNQLDIVINNVDVKSENQTMLNVRNNVIGLVEGTFLGFQEMFRKGGVIINTAILEREPSNGLPISNQISHFVIGFTRSLSHNYFYQPSNVKIMAVCPLLYPEKSDDTVSEDVDALIANMMKAKSTDNTENKFFSFKYFGNAILTILNSSETGSIWIVEPHRAYKIQNDQDFYSSLPDKVDVSQVKSINACPMTKTCKNRCSNFKSEESEEKAV